MGYLFHVDPWGKSKRLVASLITMLLWLKPTAYAHYSNYLFLEKAAELDNYQKYQMSDNRFVFNMF